jgi:hypothetical protein
VKDTSVTKFPLLEQLRAEHERHEAEITQPFQAELQQAATMISQLRATVRGMERALGTKIGQEMSAMIADQMSAKVRQMVMEAAAKASRHPTEPITIHLSAETLRFMDPRSLESEILRRYARETVPALRFRVDVRPTDCVTVVDIRIPELGYRHAMADL